MRRSSGRARRGPLADAKTQPCVNAESNGMLDPGANLLTKPFSVEELAAKVRKILDEEA